MKILVTGSSGYVGSSFINQYQSKYKFENFSLLNKTIEDINFDCIDVVLHCAAFVHKKVEYPYEKYCEVNIEYPVQLAKIAKQNGVKQFVFISSIAVYGENQKKFDENSICNPNTSYGKSKLEAEKKLLELNDACFIVSIIRPPMVYGKDAPGNINSLVKFVKIAPVIPFGRIENKRSFVFIQNLCSILDEVIVKQKIGVFLASDDKALSTTRLIDLIAQSLEKKVYLIRMPFFETLLKIVKPSFHQRLYGSLEIDNSYTKKILGFKNLYTVEEGISHMFDSRSDMKYNE